MTGTALENEKVTKGSNVQRDDNYSKELKINVTTPDKRFTQRNRNKRNDKERYTQTGVKNHEKHHLN